MFAAIFAGRWVWTDYMYTPWTRDGRIRAEIVTVSADVSGWVTTLNVKDGQDVKKGQLLFSVDNKRYQAALGKAKANTESALLTWELAKHKYNRRVALKTQKAIREEDLELTRINRNIAKANYDLAKKEQDLAQLNVDRTEVVAPVSGQIINLNLRQGVSVFAIVKSNSFYAHLLRKLVLKLKLLRSIVMKRCLLSYN